MESGFSGRKCVIITLRRGISLGTGGVRLLVNYALRHGGGSPWAYISAEVFCGKHGETLIIARPAEPYRITVTEYALALIHKYFID